MFAVPKPYPKEFREDVVRSARAREAGVTLAQVAKDFGIHEMTLNKWRLVHTDGHDRPPVAHTDSSSTAREQ